jgi:UDP-N-acetylmuramate--alanine ligase
VLPEISQDDLRKLLSSSPRRAHLVGIAGSGMNGLARIFVQRGHRVSGSDQAAETEVEGIRELGIQRFRNHAAEHVDQADFVCFSSAIPQDNPELLESQRRGIRT